MKSSAIRSAACVSLALVPALFCLVRAEAPAAGPAHPLLLIANKIDQTVVIFDPVTGRELAAVPTGGNTAHELTSSPDGRFAYAPIYGDSGVGRAGTNGDTVAVIDLHSHTVSGHIKFTHGVRPHFPIYDTSRNVLYITTELDQTISIVDPKTLKIVGTIPTGEPETHMFITAHDWRRAYTANVGPGTISVLDLASRAKIAEVKVAPHIQRISISRDDHWVFTSDTTKPELDVLDTSSNTIVKRIALPGEGYGSASTLDGKSLLIAIPTLNKVAVIDLAHMAVTRTIDVCTSPQEVVVEPGAEDTAYVSCVISGQVAAFHPARGVAEKAIDIGKGTDGLAWATGR